MLRAGFQTLTRSALGDSKLGSSAFSLEFVRWRRKPRWLPVAKSKLYRVPERKRQPADERAELFRLHNNYKTQMRSVRQYLREEAVRIKETTTADHIVLTPEQEEAEFQRCLDLNAEWNRQIAAEREQRLAKEREERAAIIQQRIEARKWREEEHLERIEDIVRREKEASKTFITRDTIDQAIEVALANPVDYNFAIDLKGNMYVGRNTLPGGGSGGGGSPDGGKAIESGTEQQQQLQASN